MTITTPVQQPEGWFRFNLNVGGFTIKNCRWYPRSRRVYFPYRYDQGQPHQVVFVYPVHLRPLRRLLESGQTSTPRDRRPCTFGIRFLGVSHERLPWMIFDFTVRGFTILGTRWQPQSRSVQLPASFIFDASRIGSQWGPFRKKLVVCAPGPHINRLRTALEAALQQPQAAVYRGEIQEAVAVEQMIALAESQSR